jgi:hypothetical protein
MVPIILCSPLRGPKKLCCDQEPASPTERINSTLFVCASPTPKANTINVRPGRYIIEFDDLNLQSGKETLLTSTDHQNLPDIVFLERNSVQVPAKSCGERIIEQTAHRTRSGGNRQQNGHSGVQMDRDALRNVSDDRV